MMGDLMKLDHISMHFQGLKAVDEVSFDISGDEIFDIIGPNGAGKTTLFNVMTGFYRPTAGTVRFEGKDMSKKTVYQFSEAGLSRTFQNIRVFGQMTVEENLLVGMHNRYHPGIFKVLFGTGKNRKLERELREKAGEILDYLGIAKYAYEQAASLPYGIQRKVEIGRALANDPKLILLDEPTAGMNQNETDELGELIRDMFVKRHLGVVVIEHNMPFMMNLTQKIAVLSFGRLLALGTPDEIQNNQSVIDAYLGEEDE